MLILLTIGFVLSMFIFLFCFNGRRVKWKSIVYSHAERVLLIGFLDRSIALRPSDLVDLILIIFKTETIYVNILKHHRQFVYRLILIRIFLLCQHCLSVQL